MIGSPCCYSRETHVLRELVERVPPNIAVERAVTGLAPGNEFTVYNPRMSKKSMSMFLFTLWTCLAFFGRGDVGLLHCEDCCSIPVDPRLDSSDDPRHQGWVIQGTLMEILTNFGTEFLLIGVKSQSTNFAALQCMFKSDVRIACTVPCDTSMMAAMSLMDLRRSSCISRRVVCTFSGVELVEDCSMSLSSDVLLLLKRACHSNHFARLIASLSYT